MKKALILFIALCLLALAVQAQTYSSAQSHKQATATSQSITADGAGAAVDVTGYSQVLVTVRGTYTVVDIDFEASPDATNYFPVLGTRVDSSVTELSSGNLTDVTRAWRFNVTGFTRFRHNTDWTSGTVNVTITPVSAASDLGVTVAQATAANLNATVTGSVTVGSALPAGTNNIGDVDVLSLPALPTGSNVIGAVTQSGTWNLNNISGTVSLPTGASTAAKQPALGTAGSASADVLSVQGIASMTPLLVNGSGVTQPVSGTVTANAGTGTFTVSGTVTANAGTNLNTSALALESGGNLATVAGAVRAEDVASGDGHTGIPAMAVRKATPANTSGTDGDYENLQISAGRLWTSTTIDAALPAGTNAIGKLAANSGVDIGDVDVTSVPTDPFGLNADAASATGSISAKLRFIASTGIPITGTVTVGSHAVTNAGTFAVQPAGSVAHDAAASSVNPVLLGGYASAAAPADVSADTDSVRAWHLRNGAAAVQPTFAGVLATTGNGVAGTGVQRVAIASDNTAFTVNVGTFPDNEPFNIAQMNGVAVTMGNGASGTGVQRVTIANDSTGVVGLNAGSNLIGFTVPSASATTTNAATTYYLTSAASTNSTNVKSSAGNVYTIRAINTTATIYYLRMYNASSAPTCSSATNFIETIPIPASTSGGGIAINQTVGQAYSSGIGFCLTGGGSSTDNTNAATGVYLTILYK